MSKLVKKDADGNEYVETTYFCRDQNNISCHFVIKRYKNLSDVIFGVEYSNMIVTIHAKVIKAAVPIPTTKPKEQEDSSDINRT
jgi:hypothetical protein